MKRCRPNPVASPALNDEASHPRASARSNRTIRPPGRALAWLAAIVWSSRLGWGAEADGILDWNELMLDAVRADNSGPTLSTRNLAILQLSMYDAVNGVEGTHQPYWFTGVPPAGASAAAAALGAGYQVMSTLYPSFQGRTDALYVTQRAALPDSAATTSGIALGRQVAIAMIDLRSRDGANTQVPYIPSDAPGQWRRTPPYFRPPLDPHWRYVQLFALPSKEPFVPPPPPPLDSPEYAVAFDEVKELGARQSAVRTTEQSQIAVFWSDFSYTAMPPGHWHEIAASIVRERGVSLADAARLFALIGLTQADAAIVCWEAKYRFNRWRPITAIQRADEDANDATVADLAWDHYLADPPFPEYPSGHSTFSKASAQVLIAFFGTDAIRFSATSDSLPGVVRSFDSLTACADEIGMSRIYGGIHFQFANREGKRSGGRIGDFIGSNYLLPNAGLPSLRVEHDAANAIQVRVHGHVGRECVLEASADLFHWLPVATNVAVAGGFVVADAPLTPTHRFFRTIER